MAKRLSKGRISAVRARRRRRSLLPRSRNRSLMKGRPFKRTHRAGYQIGWEYGYHLGRCHAVAKLAGAGIQPPRQPIRLMYITSGLGLPYTPLDQVIADSFNEQVTDFTVASPSEDLVRLATEFKPHAAVMLDGVQRMSAEQLDGLRALGIKTAAWFVDDPYYTDFTSSMAFHYDIVFTIELSCFNLYRDLGHPNVHYLPLGVHPQAFSPVKVNARYHSDICFIGTAFWNRVNFFDSVAPYLQGKKFRIIGLWWDRMRNYQSLRSNISLNHWLSPEETAKYYSGAKIVVNLHRSYDDTTYNRNSMRIPALSLNPRAFEIAACGAFQLSDVREDMQRYFSPSSEIETFSSPEEFIHKVNYYLANREARQTVALNGLKRTLTDHTFQKRIAEILQIIMQ